MRNYAFFVFTMIFFAGYAMDARVQAQTYQERQLIKLYYQKTRKPRPEERAALQREWNRERQRRAYQQELKRQNQIIQRINHGKELAARQSRYDHLRPLKQANSIGEAVRESAHLTERALRRQARREYYLKKSLKYKSRNRLRPPPPIFRIQFRPK